MTINEVMLQLYLQRSTNITTMNILNQYKNGNSLTSIYEDGTRIRQIDSGEAVFSFPENIDIKITNYCNMDSICQYCHEMSNKEGTHGDLDLLFEKISDLPAGVELAIGGGSTTDHPNLEKFLYKCKEKGYICNITVNQLHLTKKTCDYIFKLISNDLVKGVGISYRNESLKNIETFSKLMIENNYKHAVIHLIAGLDDHKSIELLKQYGFTKFLVLGYKTFGNGVSFYKENKIKIDINLKKWYQQITRYFNEDVVISFDNLAITQLNIRRFFSTSEWDMFYQGDDFTCSMYIDAVEQTFAPTSRSENRKKYSETSLMKYFQNKKKFIEVSNVSFYEK